MQRWQRGAWVLALLIHGAVAPYVVPRWAPGAHWAAGQVQNGPACPGCFFTSPQSAFLYSGPTTRWGRMRLLDTGGWSVPGLSTNDHGFGAPIQHTNGRYGFTRFNDLKYGPGWRHDHVLAANPPADVWTPSCGWLPPHRFGAVSCWDAYDGKDFVIDDANGNFYELDMLFVNAAGHPINRPPYGYGSGPCGNKHQPPCGVRGVFAGNLRTSPPNLGGGTAAGIVSGAGDIVPGELDCATCLNHAVQVVAAASLVNRTTCDAFPVGKNGDGQGRLPAADLCEGGVLQYTGDWRALDPATHSPAVLALARALALYGGLITDQGGSGQPGFTVYTDYDSAPPMQGAADLLRGLAVYYGHAQLQ